MPAIDDSKKDTVIFDSVMAFVDCCFVTALPAGRPFGTTPDGICVFSPFCFPAAVPIARCRQHSGQFAVVCNHESDVNGHGGRT